MRTMVIMSRRVGETKSNHSVHGDYVGGLIATPSLGLVHIENPIETCLMQTVLHLIETSGPGGAERMLVTLARATVDQGYRSLACLRKDGWLREQLESAGIETTIIPQDRRIDWTWLRAMAALLRRTGVSTLHAHEFAMNTHASLLSRITGVPCVATVHGKNYYAERWQRRLAYRFVARTATLVAVSEDVRSFLINSVGIPRERVHRVANGVDVMLYGPCIQTRERVRRELGLQSQTYTIGTVASLYPVKGHEHLLRAVAIVAQRCPQVHLLLIGRGGLQETLQQQAGALGIASRVTFLGLRDDVPALLQAMDVFALPSLSEGLPLSLLEAMACGKPVVASNVGGVAEAVIDGETGLLVAPADHEGLAAGILRLFETQIARRLGENARERVCRHFSLSRMVGEYLRLYQTAT